ncbi:alpha/beta hydrolase family protein [Vibrio rhizosphaerae]|uniref:Alpha/beta hydrolase n=1 Tax=Vibrio rhizosphaerae TaxID=398736 RepID=A0ABU4J061_9VIBR|nr:alpha/beta hydrolase [Vibrio rhizosphaerae]MDW6093904.1 alpha/beta hydrolase [Vibrio rhizosphaerae]
MIKYKSQKSLLLLVVLIFLFMVFRFLTFGLENTGTQRTLSFTHGSDVLSGTLILPPHVVSPPFVVFIHGDGPQDRWSNGGYVPLVRFLVSNGIAVYSWDKPGVGLSSGNWFAQTMFDRSVEAATAMKQLRELPELRNSRGGYLGFSQAGWVVPKASQLTKTDFAVLVGAAINWRSQSIYYTGERLKLEHYAVDAIKEAQKKAELAFNEQFSIAKASEPCASICTRADFERRNSQSDARKDISEMHTATLLLMGEQDRNVDHTETVDVWHRLLPRDVSRCIKQLPNATHGLLRSELFDYQLSSQWPVWKEYLFVLFGRYSYSPNAFNIMAHWIKDQQCPN